MSRFQLHEKVRIKWGISVALIAILQLCMVSRKKEALLCQKRKLCYIRLMLYKAPDDLVKIAEIFTFHGYELYLVGGAVRDYILGNENHDYDMTTSALPEEVKAMFKATIDTGIKHGTVTVVFNRRHYEITTFRTEGDYSDSRHPDSVKFVRSLDEDLKRRDFTINALAVDILSGEIIDRHNGIEDLEKRIIRAIGVPEERFKEDALRMLRACRFSSKLDFDIEEETLSSIKDLHRNIEKVSKERIKDEIDKLLLSPYPAKGLGYMAKTGLWETIMDGVELTPGTYSSLERAKKASLPLTSLYSVLFAYTEKEKIEKILDTLKASNKEKNEILLLTAEWDVDTELKDPISLRRKIKRVGKENVASLIALRKALGKDSPKDKEYDEALEREKEKNPPLSIKELDIKGEDLKGVVSPGPEMGRILNALLEMVIENPSLNEREGLLKRAEELSNPCF